MSVLSKQSYTPSLAKDLAQNPGLEESIRKELIRQTTEVCFLMDKKIPLWTEADGLRLQPLVEKFGAKQVSAWRLHRVATYTATFFRLN